MGMHKPADRIRNVALVGHRGSGKTSLHEALLFQAGAVNAPGIRRRRHDGLRRRPRRAGAADVDLRRSLSSFEWQDRKINLLDTPGEPSFVADALGVAARLRVGRLRRQRRHGRRGLHARASGSAPPSSTSRGMIFVNMLDRERADFFRTLDSPQGAPSARTSSPPRSRSAAEHEVRGVIDLVDMKAYEYDGAGARQLPRDPDPRRAAGAGRGVPREAHGRGRRGLRARSWSATSRARRSPTTRSSPRSRTAPTTAASSRSSAASRRATWAPTGCSTRSSRTSPRRSSTAACELPAITLEPDEDARALRLRLQDHAPTRSPGASTSSASTRASMDHDTHVLNTRAHGKERIGQLLVFAGQGDEPRRRVRPRRHRRRRQAQGDARRRLARRARRADHDAGDQAARAGHGVRDGAEDQGRRGQGLHRRCAACRRRTRRSTCTATRRPASRSSRGCRRCTSRSSSTG